MAPPLRASRQWTALYTSYIEILSAKKWKKIISAALKIVEEKKGPVSKPASAAKAPHHRQIIHQGFGVFWLRAYKALKYLYY